MTLRSPDRNKENRPRPSEMRIAVVEDRVASLGWNLSHAWCLVLGAWRLAQLEVASPRETGNQAIALPARASPYSPPYPFILYHTYQSCHTIPRHTIPCLLVLVVLQSLPYSTMPYPIMPYYAIASFGS